MGINWKVRIKNPLFWAQVAVAILSPVLVGLGLQWDQMNTWPALGEALWRAVQNPVIVVSVVGSLWTCITDPTTAGLGDSKEALTYTAPKRD
ncbi:MAG TPA: phage holin family protein [Candidatus Acutalibacter pullicola]|uniref:Phage holin family protein n=1 Tax=Candidatus Acutalibacter pullicola TaxID=2838417 RepID=A0A9D2MXC4_9FIRM|nr:phage holin family protein [Candidatus Acutalibacter pullicola]